MRNENIGIEMVNRIDSALKQQGKTRQKLADACEFTVTNIVRWKTKGCIPDVNIGLKVADYLGVSVRWLVTGKDSDNELTNEERALLERYRFFDDRDKEVVDAMTEKMSERYKNSAEEEKLSSQSA